MRSFDVTRSPQPRFFGEGTKNPYKKRPTTAINSYGNRAQMRWTCLHFSNNTTHESFEHGQPRILAIPTEPFGTHPWCARSRHIYVSFLTLYCPYRTSVLRTPAWAPRRTGPELHREQETGGARNPNARAKGKRHNVPWWRTGRDRGSLLRSNQHSHCHAIRRTTEESRRNLVTRHFHSTLPPRMAQLPLSLYRRWRLWSGLLCASNLGVMEHRTVLGHLPSWCSHHVLQWCISPLRLAQPDDCCQGSCKINRIHTMMIIEH